MIFLKMQISFILQNIFILSMPTVLGVYGSFLSLEEVDQPGRVNLDCCMNWGYLMVT